MTGAAQYGPMLGFAALMVFIVYRRARQHIGRQTVKPRRMAIRAGMFCLMAATLVVMAPASALPYMIAGAVVGTGIALWALRLTVFEHTIEAVFYRSNMFIGLGVTALLIGRLGYRLVQMSGVLTAAAAHAADAPAPPTNPWAGMVNNPLTLGVLFITVGYYIVFYVGILRKAKHGAVTSTGTTTETTTETTTA